MHQKIDAKMIEILPTEPSQTTDKNTSEERHSIAPGLAILTALLALVIAIAPLGNSEQQSASAQTEPFSDLSIKCEEGTFLVGFDTTGHTDCRDILGPTGNKADELQDVARQTEPDQPLPRYSQPDNAHGRLSRCATVRHRCSARKSSVAMSLDNLLVESGAAFYP